MIKWLLKKFIPSSASIAELFADRVAAAVNNSGKEEIIARYGGYAAEWTKCQDIIVTWLQDGKIDDEEKAQLAKAVEPIVEKIVQEIKQ